MALNYQVEKIGLTHLTTYWGRSFSVFLGEKPFFLLSDDYIQVVELLCAYDFININFEDQVIYAHDYYFTNRERYLEFEDVLSRVKMTLEKYAILIHLEPLGHDDILNVDSNGIIY